MTINISSSSNQQTQVQFQPVRIMGAYDTYKKIVAPATKTGSISLGTLKNTLKDKNIYVIEKDSGVTPLHWAIKKGNIAAVKVLLELGFDQINRNSLVKFAAAEKQKEILQLLANQNIPLEGALASAVSEGDAETIKILIDIHMKTGNTSELESGINKAIRIGNIELAKLLIQVYQKNQNQLPFSILDACVNRLNRTGNHPDQNVKEILDICLKEKLDLSDFMPGFMVLPPSLLSVCTPKQLDQFIQLGYCLDHSSIEAMVQHNRIDLLKQPKIFSQDYCRLINNQLRKYEPLYPKVHNSPHWGQYTDPREYAGHLAVIHNKINLLAAIVTQKGRNYDDRFLNTAAAYGNRDVCELYKLVFTPNNDFDPIVDALPSCSTKECFDLLLNALSAACKSSSKQQEEIQEKLMEVIPEMLKRNKLNGALARVIKEAGLEGNANVKQFIANYRAQNLH